MSAAAAPASPPAAGWQCGGHWLDTRRPLVMGIINVTPDSFSDGGRWQTTESAYRRGMALLEDGADILDVGGESTRPGADEVAESEEMRRVLPVIERLAAAGAVVSADTMKTAVMRRALDAGAAILNDVNGFCAEGAATLAAKADCGLVIMHKRGAPRVMQDAPAYADVVGEVAAFLRQRAAALVAAGAARARLCADPGIGFGKTRAHNVALINNLASVGGGLPVLAGISRKSLFAAVCPDTPAAGRDVMSAIAAGLLLERGAAVLRAHNVALTVQAAAVQRLLRGEECS